MTTASALPLSVRAQRVLLWTLAVIMAMNVLTALVDAGGGLFGAGYALPYVLLGAACAVCAVRLPRAERWVRGTVVAVHVILLLGELGRLAGGDVRAIVGVLLPVLGLVLVARRTARRFAASGR